jgi:hypothetical protein
LHVAVNSGSIGGATKRARKAADLMLSPEPALNILWAVWYVTWLAAVVFSARTKT